MFALRNFVSFLLTATFLFCNQSLMAQTTANNNDDILDLIIPVIINTAKPVDLSSPIDLSSAVSYVPQKIELGWFNLTPCSRTTWVGGDPYGSYKTETAPQEVHVYATIMAPTFDNLANYVQENVRQAFQNALNNYLQTALDEFKNGLAVCAVTAGASAGVAALASYGTGAVSTFISTFSSCADIKIDELIAYFNPASLTIAIGKYLSVVGDNIFNKLNADISSSVAFSQTTICQWPKE